MNINVKAEIPDLSGKPIEIEGKPLILGVIIMEALLASKLQSSEEKQAIWQTIKMTYEAINQTGVISVPTQETMKFITEHIWHRWPVQIAGPSIDYILANSM